ncbi:MAG: hypothetical protein LKG42_03735 [Eubacterium sp.]|jgi:hypothetical protein|nr:hypothetical protein [Eubacterium sp.]MCH4046617.1 hypothetical protein [Eubacterium sp.]MCH4079713.1 hypothetical protein [Eubacterium sp.]MCH4110273.1 hypothetical protein [Eubacterium sp.]MCI1307114.1 hypothetical protein [Eubacterium sp.]
MRRNAGRPLKKRKSRKGRYVKNWKKLNYFCPSEDGKSVQVYGVKKKNTDLWVGGKMKVVSLGASPLPYQAGQKSYWNKAGMSKSGKQIWWKHQNDSAALRRFKRNAIAVAVFSRNHKSGQTLRQYEQARAAKVQRVRMFMFLVVACIGMLFGAAFFNQSQNAQEPGAAMRSRGIIAVQNAGNTVDGGTQSE